MKTKLTLTVDEDLVPRAKRYARERGVSLSSVVEDALRQLTSPEPEASFVDRWRGSMRLADRTDDRYQALVEKYQ
jgi:hypothetical protein